MSNLKVAQIGKYYHPCRGGVESSLYSLVSGLKEKIDFQVIVSNTKPKTTQEDYEGVRIFRLARFGVIFSQPLNPLLLFRLKKIKADIIHLHLPNPLAMIFYLIARPRGKLVISYHSDIVRQKMLKCIVRTFLISVLEKADAIVVTSANLIDTYPILLQFRKKCSVIPHGVDLDRFKKTPRVAEQSKKIRQRLDGQIILFVGRLVYYKGLIYLIKAMKGISAKLIIIGDGNLRLKLKARAFYYGVNKKIFWLKDVLDEELPFYYYACDLFALPSCAISESFGMAMLEAHACGKPVVSADLPTGVRDVNVHQKTGIVVPPREPQALAGAIKKLLDSADLRDNYGKAGRLRVEKEFTREDMCAKFLILYRTIISK